MKLILLSLFAVTTFLRADHVVPDKDIPVDSVEVKVTAKRIFKMKDPKYGTDMAVVSEPRLSLTPALTLGAGTLEDPKVEVGSLVPYVLPNESKGIVDANCYFICRTLGYLQCEPTKSMMSKRPCEAGKEWGFDSNPFDMSWSASRCTAPAWLVWTTVTCTM